MNHTLNSSLNSAVAPIVQATAANPSAGSSAGNPAAAAGSSGALAPARSLSLILLLAMALPMLMLYAVGALAPLLLDAWQIAPAALGWVNLASFGLAALLSLFAGALVARLGGKLSLVLLFLLLALAYGLMISLPGFGGVLAAVAIGGVAQALCNPATNLLIARQIAPTARAGVVGFKQAGVQCAALFAGLALPLLAHAWGWRVALGSMLPLALLFAAFTWWRIPADVAAGPVPPWRALLVWPVARLRWLMAVQLCAGIALSAFVTWLPLFAHGNQMSVAQGGQLLALFGVMGIVSRVVLTPLAARLQDESRLLCALLLLAAGALLLLLQTGPALSWGIWLATLVLGLSAVATNAIAMAMLLRDAQFGNPAQGSGWLSVAFFGGMAGGPLLFGWSLQQGSSFALGWLLLSGVLLLGALAAACLSLVRMGRPA